MKFSNRKLVDNASALGNLIYKQLPVRVSYALSKNISKLEKELEIYNKERQKLLDKYCVKDDKGRNKIDENNNLEIAKEYLDDWNREVNELLDIEFDIEIYKFNKEDLLNSKCDITVAELMLIEYMMED